MNKARLVFLLLLLGFWAEGAKAQSAPETQCVASAFAGGTGDAITIPALPCALTTNLLILSVVSANTTTTPTLQPLGLPAQVIVRAGGGPLAPYDLPAGGKALLNPTGTQWILLNPAGSVTNATVANNNTALAALPVVNGEIVARLGFVSPNDSPVVYYKLSSTPCSAADLGAQVTMNGIGCANAQLGPAASAAVWGVVPYSVCVAGGTSSATCIATLQAQLQAALNYSAAAQVSLTIPCGIYEASGTFTIAANAYVTGPVGPGTSNCVSISSTSGTLIGLDITGGSYYVGYITIDKVVAATAGYGVKVENDLGGRLDHVVVQDNYGGFSLGATANSYCDFCIAQQNYANGFFFTTSSDLDAMQWQMTHSISQLNNGVGFDLYVSGTSPAPINATDPTFLDSGSYANTGGGFFFSGDAGSGNNDLTCYHCYSSFDGNNGIAFTNLGLNNLFSNTFVEATGIGSTGRGGTTAASNVGWGLLVNGTNGGPASLAITGGAFSSNSYAGISVNTGLTATINVSNTIVYDNGAATPGLYGAVYVQSPGITLTGVTAGNLASARAPYGLQVSSAAVAAGTVVSASTFTGTTTGCNIPPLNGGGVVGFNCSGLFYPTPPSSNGQSFTLLATYNAIEIDTAVHSITSATVVFPSAPPDGTTISVGASSSATLTLTAGSGDGMACAGGSFSATISVAQRCKFYEGVGYSSPHGKWFAY